MRKHIIGTLIGALAVCSACSEPLSSPNQDAVVAGTPQRVQNLVTGILATDRSQASAFAYILYPETMARNTAYLTTNEPRFINEIIGVPIDPSDFIGSSGWTGGYQTARATTQLLANSALAALPAGDQNAVKGLVLTIKALDYIRNVTIRDSLGAPIQGADPSVVDPWRTKQAVLTYVSALLDSGYAALTAAGVS